MRLLYLDQPHLPLRIEAARRRLPELVVLGGQPWEPGVVLDCSPVAHRLGVRRGQPLASAHNLVPEATFLPADLDAYRRVFERVLDTLAEFTPALEGESDPEHDAFGRAFLGIEGLDRLWGTEPALVRRVTAAAAPLLTGPPRVGIGNTRFGAQVAAVVGGRRRRATAVAGVEAIPAGGAEPEAAYLAPLPIRLLPVSGELLERFRVFGLRTIGDFAALPRSAVTARFGTHGADLHDLARGMDGRQLKPRRPVERLRADAELEPPVDALEPLRFVLHNLAGALCDQIAARGAGAGRARLTLELEGAPRYELDQPLPEPVAAADLIERLLLARLEASPPRSAVTRLSLELDGTAPAAGQQLALFARQSARAGRLAWQLTGLAIRFGPDRIHQARLLDPEALLPEDRFEWRGIDLFAENAAAVPGSTR